MIIDAEQIRALAFRLRSWDPEAVHDAADALDALLAERDAAIALARRAERVITSLKDDPWEDGTYDHYEAVNVVLDIRRLAASTPDTESGAS